MLTVGLERHSVSSFSIQLSIAKMSTSLPLAKGKAVALGLDKKLGQFGQPILEFCVCARYSFLPGGRGGGGGW